MHINQFIELHTSSKSLLKLSSPLFGETLSKLLTNNSIEYVYLASEGVGQLVPVYVTKDSIIVQLNTVGQYVNHYYQNTAVQQVKNVLGLNHLEHKQLILERYSECAVICVTRQVTLEEVLCNFRAERNLKVIPSTPVESSAVPKKTFANKLYNLFY